MTDDKVLEAARHIAGSLELSELRMPDVLGVAAALVARETPVKMGNTSICLLLHTDYYQCPLCAHTRVSYDSTYCRNCGSRLAWD